MHPMNRTQKLKPLLATMTATVLLSLISMNTLADDHCGKGASGPLPDCVELKYKGGGTIKLRNHCDFDVEIRLDHSVGGDSYFTLKANHEKNFVSRFTVNPLCCWENTPQCPREEPDS